ncbi:hypothetical protein LSCM1_02268 [Leishmania martiniquensis]|uniref:Transmembrane protein n=1 Tax=Leishmania martiniquensis TaxID=1580590 RepID=A0A836K9I6_9TRYP|nr:hypothetical protein LSCM1_02268 [Leishmania martiniquensis]
MRRESASSSQGGEDGGYGVTDENALRRSALLPALVSPEASGIEEQFPLIMPPIGSPASSPLLDRRCSSALTVDGPVGSAFCGAGACASPQLPPVSSRVSLSPPRSAPSGSGMSLSPLRGTYSSLCMPQTLCSGSPIGFPMTSSMPPCFPSPTAANHAVLKAGALPSPSHRLLRLALGAFCMLNAAIAFLFTWMMRTQQASFALTAVKRRWDLQERSHATFKAGVYYVFIGLVLLVNRLSSLLLVAVQLGVRCVRAGGPLLLRWLVECARRLPYSRACGPLLQRFAPRVAGVSWENHRALVRSRVVRPPRSLSAAVPPVSVPSANQSHGLLQRSAGHHLGPLLQHLPVSTPAESLVDSEMDRRLRAATARSFSIRRRVG